MGIRHPKALMTPPSVLALTPAIADTSPQIERAREHLHRYFGYEAFRGEQERVISAILSGHNVLAVLPTGAGKSVCYQIPALVTEGLCLVISPLIALMSDQVAALKTTGVRAERLDSSLTPEGRQAIWDAAGRGEIDLLYLSPEALQPYVLERISRLNINLLAIDEAHCISQWGHDFRPEYRALGQLRRQLAGVPTLALTATADAHTRADILAALGMAEAEVIVSNPDRPNLSLRFERRKGPIIKSILGIIGRQKQAAGIIYAGSRDGTEKIAAALNQAGFNAEAYHAGLSASVREARLKAFMKGETHLMVATIAFGMGINKADVRFVIHADPPASLEAYWQEVGRAGRDGKPASGVCFYGSGDLGWALRRSSLREGEGAPDQSLQKEKARAFHRFVLDAGCRVAGVRTYFGEEAGKACGHCDNCLSRKPVADLTEPAQMLMSALYRFNGPRGRKKLIEHVMGQSTGRDYGKHLPTFGVARGFTPDTLAMALDVCEAHGLIEEELYDNKMPIVALKDVDAVRRLFKAEIRFSARL
jgi:ATP-dependent DNA helicase RecQ